MGSEARNPLKTIPRAVMLSAILGGAFFTVCAYAEVLGFHTVVGRIGDQPCPHARSGELERRAGVWIAD
jgi:amino acid transporter